MHGLPHLLKEIAVSCFFFMKPRKGNRLGIMKAFIYVNACLYQLIEIPQAYPNECSEMEISERTSYGQAESLPEKVANGHDVLKSEISSHFLFKINS
ncbi:hypothetical protein D918_07028 [Trichuris suis]|nr:hypothetical protein D918_07028 [Trichuris suis]